MPLDLGKKKPMGEADKAEPMGDDTDSLDTFEAALDDAFDAVEAGDREAFRSAMGAAVSAKCAEMYASDEDEEL